MKALCICFVICLLMIGMADLWAAPAPTPDTNVTAVTEPHPGPPADGLRPEDVMIDDDAIGDVWETISPADAIGITDENADVLPAVTAAVTSAELLQEQELLKRPRSKPKKAERVRTERWRPDIPVQTLFYLMLAVIVVVVLLLKAKG
ncbi:MAG: hypothetical protein QGH42_11390 [Kiritimatiellia bacterium]|jgi:hypothetical protein|nr:hypothetical protein [Kiritimatiellia bacterium]MDP6631099.1 hypothetical protein [Kiritimatiellia bacterium]MDP6810055.1 hypothetical protein [Kiritimatiellia bacterium]MDP7024826.1 hypothetical protein [Kiritimatiellia bacterium]